MHGLWLAPLVLSIANIHWLKVYKNQQNQLGVAGANTGFFSAGARKNAENQGHRSIELEMFQQYMDELRVKRAANFEARNVHNCVKFW